MDGIKSPPNMVIGVSPNITSSSNIRDLKRRVSFQFDAPNMEKNDEEGHSNSRSLFIHRNSDVQILSSTSDISLDLETRTKRRFNTLQQLLTHVPNLVVRLTQKYYSTKLPLSIYANYGVFMFIDISGFTALCEKYCSDISAGRQGIDALTAILNQYLGQLVQHLIESNGDVLKFAGDAILALWNCPQSEASEHLQWVIKTALELQNKHDCFEADDHSILRVKVAISAGNYSTHLFGSTNLLQFAVCGEAVASVNRAQNAATSGSVFLSPEAWKICRPKEYVFSETESGFIRISDITLKNGNQKIKNPCSNNDSNPMLHNIFLNMLKTNSTEGEDISIIPQLNTTSPQNEYLKEPLPTNKKPSSVGKIKSNIRRISTFPFHKTNAVQPSIDKATPAKPSLKELFIAEYHMIPHEEKCEKTSNLNSASKSSCTSVKSGFRHCRDRKSTLDSILQSQMTISKHLTPEMLNNIRHYLPKAVKSKIDSGQSLEWLSELRTISVVFINIDMCIEQLNDHQAGLIQEALVYVHETMIAFDGCINKIFMFDKGSTILAFFGLPQAKHEDDPSRALQSSTKIYSHLTDNLKLGTSIGIATGQAFCGVVGHTLRHEYTAIGAKVNMAARLMTNFRYVITCDQTTKTRSGVSDDNFQEMTTIALKGIQNPEQVYSFSLSSTTANKKIYFLKGDNSVEIKKTCHLIGRDEELNRFKEMLYKVNQGEQLREHVLILTGDPGIGKSSLLRLMKQQARNQLLRVVSCRAGLMEMNNHFHTVKLLIERLLQLDLCHSLNEREQTILQQFRDEYDVSIKEYLPLLNDLLMLKFPQTDHVINLTSHERLKNLHRLLHAIVEKETSDKSCIFTVDDAHYMDKESWEFLYDLANHRKVLLVLAMNTPDRTKLSDQLKEIIYNKKTRLLPLKGLDHSSILEIAKRMLDVNTIGEDFEKFLKEKVGVHGNPMWCEEALETMLDLRMFQFESSDHKLSTTPISSTSNSLEPYSSLGPLASPDRLFDGCRKMSCVRFAPHVKLEDINLPLPESLNDLILARLDRLSPIAQITLKCAAIIGTTFSKSILKHITPNVKSSELNKATQKLIQAGMIECAYSSAFKSSSCKRYTNYIHLCPCIKNLAILGHSNTYLNGLHSQEHTRIFENCEILKFTHNYIQEIVYELWTNKQRRTLHESAAIFLESEAHKCSYCGGGSFLNSFYKLENVLINTNSKTAIHSAIDSVEETNAGFVLIKDEDLKKRKTSILPRYGAYKVLPSPEPLSKSDINDQRNSIMDMLDVDRVQSKVDLNYCTCAEVLATVYPQLVRHWRAAKNFNKCYHYLLESALASAQIYATLEARSLLDEAEELVKSENVKPTKIQYARFNFIKGQSFYNGEHYLEAKVYFEQGLSYLDTPPPSSKFKLFLSLIKNGFPQFKSIYCRNSPPRLENSHPNEIQINCERMTLLSYLISTYHRCNRRYQMICSALTMTNLAEMYRFNDQILMDSYRLMLKCCEQFNFKRGINHYQVQTTFSLTNCETKKMKDVSQIISYIELVATLVNEKLYAGSINEALYYVKRALVLSRQLNALELLLHVLPLWCQVQLYFVNISEVREGLNELRQCAMEADELQYQSLYYCFCYDVILETGLDSEFIAVIECESYARTCTSSDIYHFNSEERFFLLSCLTLWYARNEFELDARVHFVVTKKTLPSKFNTFLLAKGLVHYTECAILLWIRDKLGKKRKSVASDAIKKLKLACETYTILKPRALLLETFFHISCNGKKSKSQQLMREAKRLAQEMNCELELLWIEHHLEYWSKLNIDSVVATWSDHKFLTEHQEIRNKLRIYTFAFERNKKKHTSGITF